MRFGIDAKTICYATVLISCCAWMPCGWAADEAARKNPESVAEAERNPAPEETRAVSVSKPAPDLSARKRVGKASFYARQFSGKTMADGAPMDPQGDNAASRTLPLGTKAKVTNIETGKTAVVTIEDRGPYVDGRLVDLSPGTAAKIGLTPAKGITKVVVAPIAVPLPNGKVKTGAAAHEPLTQPDRIPVHDDKAPHNKETRFADADTTARDK
jgi:rare lipoprotein A